MVPAGQFDGTGEAPWQGGTEIVSFALTGQAEYGGALQGLEGWLQKPNADFRGNLLWALITLGIWCESAGIH